MLYRLTIAGAILLGLMLPAKAAFQFADIACETTATTGTGTVNLAGAVTNYLGFIAAGVTSGNTVPYQITSGDGKKETGVGTVTDATPDTMTRVADWSTNGAGAELTLSGTSTICIGPTASAFNTWTADINAQSNDLANVAQLLVGNTTALTFSNSHLATTPKVQFNATGDNGLAISAWANNVASANNIMAKSRGTSVGSAAVVQSDDNLGIWAWDGDDGTNFETAASIRGQVDGSPSNNDMPGRIVFGTTLDGAAAPTTRMTIKNDGGVIIGNGTTSPGAEDLSLEGGDLEFGNAGTAGTNTTLSYTAAGELTIEGDAIKHAGKQLMWIPASAMKNNATSPASCGDTYDSGSNDVTITVCAFDTGATEERADWQIAMPKSWNEGTVTAIPITTSTAGTVGQTVQYEIACVAISSGDTLNAAMGSAQTSSATLPASPANLSYVGAETSAITCAGTPAENDYVAFRISRDTSVDNMTGDALLLGVRLFWTDNAATLAE